MGLRISPGGQIKQSPKIDLRLKDTEGEERERDGDGERMSWYMRTLRVKMSGDNPKVVLSKLWTLSLAFFATNDSEWDR